MNKKLRATIQIHGKPDQHVYGADAETLQYKALELLLRPVSPPHVPLGIVLETQSDGGHWTLSLHIPYQPNMHLCRQCTWAAWYHTPTGRVDTLRAGTCHVPDPDLPACIRSRSLERTYIWPTKYAICKFFHEKDKAPKIGNVGAV